MSVHDRLDDALFMWDAGRKQGAWIQVLIAAAATSRMRYPRPMSDRQSFTTFIREVTPTILDSSSPAVGNPGIMISFYETTRGDGADLDELLYAQLRCTLMHEAIMQEEIKLFESRLTDGKLHADLSGVGTKASPLTIPDFWVLHLAKAVAEAPENVADCGDILARLTPRT